MARQTKKNTKKEKIVDLIGVLNGRAASLQKVQSLKVRHANLQKAPVWDGKYDNLILGDGPKGVYSTDPRVSQVNNNVLVIVGTGGGKTKSVVEANLLHAYHQSMVVLLTKRRLLDQYAPCSKVGDMTLMY